MSNNNKPVILFTWPAADELREYFHRELDSIATLVFPDDRPSSAVTEKAQNADIVVGWAVDDALLSAAKNVRLVVIPAIGVERQLQVLKNYPHVTAVNSRGNAAPTAQHAIALLLAATNYVVHFDRHMREGKWRAEGDQPPSVLLENESVGILGTGSVGTHIVRRLQGFGASVSCCSRTGRAIPDFPSIPVVPVTHLHTFLSQIRILVIAVPSTPMTHNMIGQEELGLLGENGILVNVARGVVVNERALYEALRDKTLMSAGIDVWYNYRPEEIDGKHYPWTYPFHELDNIILSPHRGASPLQRPGRFDDVVANIHRFVAGKPLLNVLNPEQGY